MIKGTGMRCITRREDGLSITTSTGMDQGTTMARTAVNLFLNIMKRTADTISNRKNAPKKISNGFNLPIDDITTIACDVPQVGAGDRRYRIENRKV
jgi:hypothetical protein